MTPTRRFFRWFALPLAGLLGAAAGVGAPVPAQAHSSTVGAASAGDSLFPTTGNGGYDVQHYDIALTYHQDGTISATTTIQATATQGLSAFSLDFDGLTISSITVDGVAAADTRSDNKLTITPKTGIANGAAFTITVSYSGKPVTYTDPDGALDGWIPTGDGATVLSEPVGAMTWFPDNDTPSDKATYDVAVTVPAGLQVAGNGDLVARPTGQAAGTWHWHQSVPMAPYLAMISIGKYGVYYSHLTTPSGVKLPVWCFIDWKLGSGAAQRAKLVTVLNWEAHTFGSYPFTSAGIVVKDFDFGYSLETQNRPVFDRIPPTGLMVHELSHQWFGDEVTPSDWGDIWLNEGFATLSPWLWNADHGGQGVTARFKQLLAAHPKVNDAFWSPAPKALGTGARLFDRAVYDRGAMTLWALHQKVGAAAFWTIVHTWLADHRYGNVTTAEFIALAEKVSGQNLDSFFTAWLSTAKRPSGY